MLNSSAPSSYVPIGPNVVYEVETTDTTSVAGVTKRAKLTTASRQEAEDFGKPVDEREAAIVKQAEEELEELATEALELGGLYAVVGGIAAASGVSDVRRYYRYLGNGQNDMRSISSPVVKGARTRKELFANNRHLPKEWINGVLPGAVAQELNIKQEPTLDAKELEKIEQRFEKKLGDLEEALFKSLKTFKEDEQKKRMFQTSETREMLDAELEREAARIHGEFQKMTKTITNLYDEVKKLSLYNLLESHEKDYDYTPAPKQPGVVNPNDLEETVDTNSRIAQLIGCDATQSSVNTLTNFLPNNQAEQDYFLATMNADYKGKITPPWVWSTMTKPVLQYLLASQVWGGLEIVASQLGRLSTFHGVSKDQLLIDLISSEDVRDVFCNYVSAVLTGHERESGKGTAGKKTAIFNNTSYKAMAAHANWKMGAKLWFENNVYYAPNPVSVADLDAEIEDIKQRIELITAAAVSERDDVFEDIAEAVKLMFEQYIANGGFNYTDDQQAELWGMAEQYLTETKTMGFPINAGANRAEKNRIEQVNRNPGYNVLKNQVDTMLLPHRFKLFITKIVSDPNNVDRKRYLTAFKAQHPLDLTENHLRHLKTLGPAVMQEYKDLTIIAAKRHFDKELLPHLKKLLFVKTRERQCYRPCILKAM